MSTRETLSLPLNELESALVMTLVELNGKADLSTLARALVKSKRITWIDDPYDRLIRKACNRLVLNGLLINNALVNSGEWTYELGEYPQD